MAVSCIGTLYHRDLGSSRVGEVFCCSLTVTAGLVLPTPFSNCNRSLVMDFDTIMCALAHTINVTRLPKYGLFPLPCHPSTLTSKPLSHPLNPNLPCPYPQPHPMPTLHSTSYTGHTPWYHCGVVMECNTSFKYAPQHTPQLHEGVWQSLQRCLSARLPA